MAEILTSKGKIILVSDEDFYSLNQHAWRIDRHGYAGRSVFVKETKKTIFELMSRRIVGLQQGDIRQVDHIDGDRLNNVRENLRICTKEQNGYNRSCGRPNKTGYKGVSKQGNRWQSIIRANGKQFYLGLFTTPEDAYAAYCKAAFELHGEFANLNNRSQS